MENATHCRASYTKPFTVINRWFFSAKFTSLLLTLSVGTTSLCGQAVLPVDNNPPENHTLTAIVAWNGQEEILLTSSTFSGDVPSAIHMTVVPSRPTPLQVASADIEGIGRLMITYFVDKGAGRMSVDSYQNAAKFPVVSVSRELPEVVQLTSERNLINWLDSSNKALGYPEAKLPGDLRRGLGRSVKEHGEWALASRLPSVSAGGTTAWAGGKFATGKPYFPLRLLAGQPGLTAKIFVITPSYASYAGEAFPYITDLTESLTVPQKDMAAVSSFLGAHFEGHGKVVIRTIEVKNLPRSFNFGLFIE